MKIKASLFLVGFCILVQISHVKSQLSTVPKEVIDKLEADVKQLKDWDYMYLLKFFDPNLRSETEAHLLKMIPLIDSKQYSEIDEYFLIWFTKIFGIFSRKKKYLDSGHTYDEKTNTWEKTVTVTETNTKTTPTLSSEATAKLEEQVKQLKDIGYLNLLKYVDPVDREKVSTDVVKIVNIVDNKQFGEIDEKMAEWFTTIVEFFNGINRNMVDGYTYDEKTNQWYKKVTETETSVDEKTIDDLEKMGNELEKWNFRELITNLEEADKEKAEPVITKMITLLKNKRHAEIDPDFVKEFYRIYKVVREARPIDTTTIVNKVKEIDNVDWEKILPEVTGIDHNLWRERIRQVIEETKTKPDTTIRYPWLRELRRIVRVIHKGSKPIHPIKLRRFHRRMRYLMKVDWRSGLRQIRGINYNLWSRRFEKVLYHLKYHRHQRMTFPWLGKFRRLVGVVYKRALPDRPVRPTVRIRPIYGRRGFEVKPVLRYHKMRPTHHRRYRSHGCH